MNKPFLIVYIVVTVLIILTLIFIEMSDLAEMLLFSLIIILTSIFSYSTRKKS